MKIIVVGGVAGGANFAARARRLSEEAEIILLERGPYVSFANCGLPYHIGGEIKERNKLLLYTPEALASRFNLDIRVNTEAIKIDAEKNEIEIRDLITQKTYQETFDHLILSPGASPVIPPFPGSEAKGVFSLRTIEDMDRIIKWIENKKVSSATVVGGGYVGIEVAEQLRERNIEINIIEVGNQILAPFDPEMAIILEKELKTKEIKVYKNQAVASIKEGEKLSIETSKGNIISTDMVILAIGVKPESTLAKEAGLVLGKSGGIKVNSYLQTSKENIWAVGDAIEVENIITNEQVLIPLAGPANRQGRLVADNIFGTRKKKYAGTLGTAILRVLKKVAACTGANEKSLIRIGKKYKALYFFPNSHAGYYPGASQLNIKVLISPETREILGAQIIGNDGVDKRIDVIATAILGKLTVDQIAQLELAYAPPFSSAKDPVNILAMTAENVLDDIADTISPAELKKYLEEKKDIFLLDVREEKEVQAGMIVNAYWIPLASLRKRINEIPRDKEIVVYCASAQRSYYALRVLKQADFKVKNLSGAYKSWQLFSEI